MQIFIYSRFNHWHKLQVFEMFLVAIQELVLARHLLEELDEWLVTLLKGFHITPDVKMLLGPIYTSVDYL